MSSESESLREHIPAGKKSDLEIFVETQVKATESKEKVSNAISNLFKGGELRIETDRAQFVSHNLNSLQFLKDQFRDRRIRSAARRLLLTNRAEEDSDRTLLLLNKQAATVPIAALCDDPKESPLGPIIMRIRSPKLMEVIDWLTGG